MICLDMQERLSAYLDGDLSAEEKEKVTEHLGSCEACQTVFNELRQVRDELRSLPEVEIPQDLHSSIMRNLEPNLRPKKKPLFRIDFRNWGYRQWVPLTAAMMVLVMFISAGGMLVYTNMLAGKGDALSGVRQNTGLSDNALVKSRGMTSTVNKAEGESAPAASPDYAMKSSEGSAGLMMAKPNTFGGAGTGAGAEPPLDVARKIIRRAQLALEVTRGGVKPASVDAIRVVQTNFGYIETSSTTEADVSRKEATSFFMVARVPSVSLDKTVQDLTVLGRTTREDTSAQDITDTYVDLDARLRNKENQESRLLQIMGQAETVGELLQVEGELSRVRGDIESMKAQKLYYDKSVDLSTITLTIAEEGATKPTHPSPWADVWRVFLEAWRQLLVFAARVAPAAIVIAALAAGGVWMARRRKA